MEIEINSPKFGKHIVLIDEIDYEIIKDYTWRINYHGKNVYAITTLKRQNGIDGKSVKMHRMILGFPEKQIDHKNRNGLDNRRQNLRVVSHIQNQQNKISHKNTTGYKGVCFSKKVNKFQVSFVSNGKNIWGGYFKTAIEAAKKYNELCLIHKKDFAILNEI